MKSDHLYIQHILDSIDKIKMYTVDGLEAFSANPMVQDAVIRNFEIIGEATKKVSDVLRSKHPEIPWRRIAGLRDVLIHDYMDVDLTEVWNVIENDLSDLENTLNKVADELEVT